MNISANPEDRLNRARICLEGLSVGDALGGFFEFTVQPHLLSSKSLPSAPWHYTDDTNMALSIYQTLLRYGTIDQDALAASFAEHFDRLRGYGMGARALMSRMRQGEHWRDVSRQMFRGEGSFGNGGAMRVAPIGAYFADDLDAVIENARKSSEITHSHPEGIAGAIAVAVAAAIVWRGGQDSSPIKLLREIVENSPESEVNQGLKNAIDLPQDASLRDAVKILGNGRRVSAQDTVPFAIWCAANSLDAFERAIWQCLEAGGDADTLCAIVGGIVACSVGIEGIPAEWIRRREPLPDWAFSSEA